MLEHRIPHELLQARSLDLKLTLRYDLQTIPHWELFWSRL